MQFIEKSFLLILAFLICFLSLIAFSINALIFNYPGNNYFPPGSALIPFLLLLIMLGIYLHDSKNPKNILFPVTKEILYYFLIMAVIVFATNAIQYTPFSPIDDQIIRLEEKYTISTLKILAWTHRYSVLFNSLQFIYNTLTYQMVLLPLLMIIKREKTYCFLREYYFLLLITALLGFSFYYFYPTLGPASSMESNLFLPEQYATGIKFNEIHHHISPSTLEGGLIAFPSFHVIWAWLCLYLIRKFRLLFLLLLPINLCLIAACVLLGWHYLTDLLGSLMIIVLAHAFYFGLKQFLSFSSSNLKIQILAKDRN